MYALHFLCLHVYACIYNIIIYFIYYIVPCGLDFVPHPNVTIRNNLHKSQDNQYQITVASVVTQNSSVPCNLKLTTD